MPHTHTKLIWNATYSLKVCMECNIFIKVPHKIALMNCHVFIKVPHIKAYMQCNIFIKVSHIKAYMYRVFQKTCNNL